MARANRGPGPPAAPGRRPPGPARLALPPAVRSAGTPARPARAPGRFGARLARTFRTRFNAGGFRARPLAAKPAVGRVSFEAEDRVSRPVGGTRRAEGGRHDAQALAD